MDLRARLPQSGRDLRHGPSCLRDREGREDPDLRRRGSTRRAAHSRRGLDDPNVATVAQQMTPARAMSHEHILIASDHAGFELKGHIERELRELGFEVDDLGTDDASSTDYADYAHPLAQRVSDGDVRR